MATRILLISGYFSPEPSGIGKYNGELMEWLAARGYECSVITSYPSYPQWKVAPEYQHKKYYYSNEIHAVGNQSAIHVFRCPMYVPAKPSGSRRVLQDISFYASATLRLVPLLFGKKYDVVLIVSPAFHLGLLGFWYKLTRKATFLYHIQDMQIEAARDLGMIKSRWLLQQMFSIEKFIFRKADMVSSISPQMVASIAGKAGKQVNLFPNWVDTSLFYPLSDKAPLKQKFGQEAGSKIILYSGAIGEKQGLEHVLEVAMRLHNDQKIRFIICGSGPYAQTLAEKAKAARLSNISFLPLQPAATFNEFLNMADVHLVLQKGKASDLVLPSKLTTILAVGGVSVITANAGTTLYDLVREHQVGISVNADDTDALEAGIRQALDSEHSKISSNARQYAEQYLGVNGIMQQFEQDILSA
ncbi:WcaI family glycosyltransferase [Chitinophaga sp. Cy-1792]|uniref:WcaI family glycosyltransferase n=1 Tax=Chitinophaga sp. Cy-1792 TaxID=2608339 RepID=UPI001420182C|nr:WcaI family glycosyltransferase [Chitinophaga sp. Cy-1792]NIG54434.1 WcaI family glycosyltransferase [Chitinophaga sp. Cy-1792]